MFQALIRLAVRSPWLIVAFALLASILGWRALDATPVDAFPDISDNQIIAYTAWPGRSPQDVEDQITYPLSTALQGVAGVREVRAMSGFGFSSVYVVFDDDVDFFWARTRVVERLSTVRDDLPPGVTPTLGPEATALGQIFWYTIDAPGYDLATQRSWQDYIVRLGLQSIEGVAEVASVGGFVRQYQIDVDPNRLKAFDVTLSDVLNAVRRGNMDVGAKTLEQNGMESVIRGLGTIETIEDIENLVVTSREGSPVFIRSVATVQIGPDFRRGALADEHGERVGGVIAMRVGANPKSVLDRVKAKLPEIESRLPPGVRIVPFYDRTTLIDETMATLRTALVQELLITVVVVMLFLMHLRTSLIVAATLPLAVLMAFVGMRALGLGGDIMSLSGIAIAIGTVVDVAIIMSENIYRALDEHEGGDIDRTLVDAATEVAQPITTAVATTVLSFVPVFLLTGQAGKLFKPLAWTKTFAMVAAVILAVTLVPALCRLVLRPSEHATRPWARRLAALGFGGLGAWMGWQLPAAGLVETLQPWVCATGGGVMMATLGWMASAETLHPNAQNPVSAFIVRVYRPLLRWVLEHRRQCLWIPVIVVVLGVLAWRGVGVMKAPLEPVADSMGVDMEQIRALAWAERVFPGLGSEFMPPLDEGAYLAMPSLLSQASLNQTMDIMRGINAEIATVPEVDQVVGKLGRANTALDPAPAGMMEIVVNLKPESLWRPGVTRASILQTLKRRSRVIGTTPSWLQPIETRLVMLQSGIRATLAIRLRGAPRRPDGRAMPSREAQATIESTLIAMENVVRNVTGAVDVTALRTGGKPYLEFDIDREAIARYGIKIRDVQDVIETAVGGVNLTRSLEGRERYPIRVQYPRSLRDSIEDLERILVPTSSGAKIPIRDIARLHHRLGPVAIRTENGQLTGYLMFNAFGRDEGAVLQDALTAIDAWRASQRAEVGRDPIPQGVSVSATGRYRNKIEADRRLAIVIPVVLLLIGLLLMIQFRSLTLTCLVFAAIPIAFSGALLAVACYPDILDMLHAVGLRDQPSAGPIYLTTAVWIGMIAMFGVAVDDGVLMATYLQLNFDARRPTSTAEVHAAVIDAGLRRIRPMLMTTTTTLIALLPILWSDGRGADVMQPMALPIVGGMIFALVSVFVVPVGFASFHIHRLPKEGDAEVA